jgi:hypothetical protein
MRMSVGLAQGKVNFTALQFAETSYARRDMPGWKVLYQAPFP